MPFDDATRNQLQRFVGDARAALTVEFTRQLQNEYGMDPASGRVAPLESLGHLDDARRETARILRETLGHYGAAAPGSEVKDLLERIVREQAFTVLNRLAALRMAEARGLLIESVGNGYTSKGFQLYARVAGTGLGEMGDAYRAYLFSIFDEFALDLSVLFDRYSPTGRLFPRETVLLHLLALINGPQIAPLWAEDETIGWIYQYFNTKEERKQMRDESSAPRNSRELAVRNQFFTPRYVVEFLTDNTLGRTWYEMTQGVTRLKETCRYLVRRPDEVFLEPGSDDYPWAELLQTGDEASFPPFELDERGRERLYQFAFVVQGFKRRPLLYGDPDGAEEWFLANQRLIRDGKPLANYTTQELLDLMFVAAKAAQYTNGPELDMDWRWFAELGNEVRQRALTSRAEGLSQEELLKQPVFVPHRPMKDPREILMLDPACGSMHFGLYAFDLYATIYEEAWEGWRYLTPADPALKSLSETYDDCDAFIRDVPRLIIEHNIHGIDIDPRAVQISGLSLWLRAQRAWHEQRVKPVERPVIRRANIVCAEPMPGEQDLLEGFIDKHLSSTPELRLLGQLIRRVFEAMKLAGEAGSLLKIEDEIAADIAEAKKKWKERPAAQQQALFVLDPADPRSSEQQQLDLDVSGISDAQFWDRAENLIYAALRQYAEETETSSYQHHLFAEDTTRGFAFIDICRKRFDSILMNPPFGDVPSKARSLLVKHYPAGSNDIYAAFVLRGSELLSNGALLGALTSRAFLAGRNHLAFRTLLLEGPLASGQLLAIFLDLGWGVLDDALVETGTLILGPRSKSDNLMFIDQRKVTFANSWQNIRREGIFFHSQTFFSDIPMRQLLYWLADSEKSNLMNRTPFEPEVGRVTTGLTTADDFRFIRLAWEVTISELGPVWVPFVKGGEYSWLSSEHHLVINWKRSGEELAAFNDHIGGNVARSRQSSHLYFKPAITWSRRSTKGLSIRRVRKGCIFSDKSPVIVPDKPRDLYWLIPLLISEQYHKLIEGQVTGASYEPSVVKVLPAPPATISNTLANMDSIFRLVDNATSIEETSPWFIPRLTSPVRIDLWKQAFVELRTLLNKTGLNISLVAEQKQLKTIEEQDVEFSLAQDRQSVCLGMILGRWNIKHLTSDLSEQKYSSFDSAPVCPPGMLQNANGIPAEPADVPSDYPLRISWSGILVDDPGHAEDVERRVQETLEVIWEDQADAIEQEACDILGVKMLRDYFRRPSAFFADHLQRYSKSRRQAPIYWPLSTASGSYTLWLYYHRLTDQTLYTCVNDFVGPKLHDVTGAANALRLKAGSRTRAEEQDLENLEQFERELTAFRDELLRLAPIWKPDLNDGVQITAAPLWKLFRLPKWQKTLKETWEKLDRGDYDWAHLAYSLWPDRVREKCKTDKSLAIAHGLEELYVEPPATAKKSRGRKTVTTEEMEMEAE